MADQQAQETSAKEENPQEWQDDPAWEAKQIKLNSLRNIEENVSWIFLRQRKKTKNSIGNKYMFFVLHEK